MPGARQWQRISRAVREALERITLAEMTQTVPAAFATPMRELGGRLPDADGGPRAFAAPVK